MNDSTSCTTTIKDDNDLGCWLCHWSIEPNPICKIRNSIGSERDANEKKSYAFNLFFHIAASVQKDDLLSSVNAFDCRIHTRVSLFGFPRVFHECVM